MSYDAVSVTLCIACGDSKLLERLQPDGARVIWFFFPRGQPCLVCWLVSPPNWREAPFPVAVPISGPALGCFCACALDVMSLVMLSPDVTRDAASRHITR